MSYTSDHLAWQQRVGTEANALKRYHSNYYLNKNFRHYEVMFGKTHMRGGEMNFGGTTTEGPPLLAAAVGLGYLK